MTLHPALSAFCLEICRPAFWACFGLSFLASAATVLAGGGGGAGVAANSPVTLAESVAILSLFGLAIPQLLLPAEGGTVDGARFAGATAAVVLAFTGVPLGLAVGSALGPFGSVETGPFRPWGHVAALLLMGWPTLLLACALAFAAGRVTGNAWAGRLAILGLLAWWLGGQVFMVGPDCRGTAALADPSGLRALAEATRYWSVQERNSLPVPLEGGLLLNRLLWLGVALSAMALGLGFDRLRARPVSPPR